MAGPISGDSGPFVGARTAAPFTRPRICVVVDTEEEFDWSAPFSRANTRVGAMRQLHRAQRVCDEFDIRPTYLVDYPVATQRCGYEHLEQWAAESRCVVGAHLHPWVTPPYNEEVSARNSFCGNLPPLLQHQKLMELTHAIECNIGVTPRSFKAGRYGVARPLLEALEALHYHVDVSVNPLMDFRAIHGPDFSAFDSRPFWFGHSGRMLEVPCTHGYVGWVRSHGRQWRRVAESQALTAFHVPGVLARLGVVNQVMLSPEGNTLDEMIWLTRTLVQDGITIFSVTFHSPSVEPGHTPYVRSQSDLDRFLRCLAGYFEFFFGELKGVASTPEDCRQDLLCAAGSPA